MQVCCMKKADGTQRNVASMVAGDSRFKRSQRVRPFYHGLQEFANHSVRQKSPFPGETQPLVNFLNESLGE